MLPVIAIVGRPNVGKSTLFNQLTKRRDAIVADSPGLTRDRQYGVGRLGEKPYWVIDTGGIGEEADAIDSKMTAQATAAVAECDFIVFLVDLRVGVTPADLRITQLLRTVEKPVYLVANKADGVDIAVMQADFFQLGLGEAMPIAAAHGRGVKAMMDRVQGNFPPIVEPQEKTKNGLCFAVVGRPNVGKSTLVNRILGEERVVVFDQPGTTRDSIRIEFTRHEKPYTMIDTAGVRRRARVERGIERFSVVKTLTAIDEADVVVMIVDGRETITEQDLHLIALVLEAGKALVVAVNKWDGLTAEKRDRIRNECDRRLHFVNYAERFYISALHGSSVGDLFPAIERAYTSATKMLSTAQINDVLRTAVSRHAPPLVRGRRIKIRYAHAGGRLPPLIVLHGNQLDALPQAYLRYLMHVFRDKFSLVGTPIRLELKSSVNPFAGRKNTLSERQVRKRKRLMRHVKRRSK